MRTFKVAKTYEIKIIKIFKNEKIINYQKIIKLFATYWKFLHLCLLYPNWQLGVQNIYRIDVHWLDEFL